MAASYNFRTALNGFHREDVVHYIEFINSKHNTQLNQLRSDLDLLQKENRELRAKPDNEARIKELEAALQAAEAKTAALEQELTEAKVKLETAAKAAPSLGSQAELEAYRRAERTERQAKERSDAMYQKASAVIAEASAKVDAAALQIAEISDQVSAQLTALQQAVTGSKQSLRDAAAGLYAIRPEE